VIPPLVYVARGNFFYPACLRRSGFLFFEAATAELTWPATRVCGFLCKNDGRLIGCCPLRGGCRGSVIEATSFSQSGKLLAGGWPPWVRVWLWARAADHPEQLPGTAFSDEHLKRRHVIVRRKLFYLAVLLTLSIALLSGCAASGTPLPTQMPVLSTKTVAPPTATPAPPTPTSEAEETAAGKGGFPVTSADALGRTVTISSKPQRIVSLSPSNTEILFAVGAGDQVVGVTKFCNYPPEAQKREQVGGFTADTISVEKIVALKPDIVFSAGKIQEKVIDALASANIPVFAVDAATFDDVYANILAVGELTGHADEAADVVAQMKDRVAVVQSKIADVPPAKRPTVFWEVWDEPLMTAGPKTFIGRMIELAGGVNIFADVTQQYPQVSAEEVIKRNPAVILGPDSHAEALTAEKIRSRPGWGDIQAVKDGRIYLINGDIASRPGPRLADGVEAIAKALYPDRFK